MQYLTNHEGKPLGVFLTMEEWASFQRNDMTYDEWERKAVLKAMLSLEQGKIVPGEEVRNRFVSLGATLG